MNFAKAGAMAWKNDKKRVKYISDETLGSKIGIWSYPRQIYTAGTYRYKQ